MSATSLVVAPTAPPAFMLHAFRTGLAAQTLTPADIVGYSAKAPQALVQLADYFGSSYLRPCLEAAADQLTHAVSLGLAYRTRGSLEAAWHLIKTEPIARHSKQGFDLLRSLAQKAGVPPAELKTWLAKRVAAPLPLADYETECEAWDAADDLLAHLR